jgi:hypothetical protein
MAINRVSQSSIQQAFPKFNTAWDGKSAVGSMDSLGVVVVPSASAATITFSSIPQTYTHLQIRCLHQNASTSNLRYQFNGDTAANYNWHQMYGDGANPGASGSTTDAYGLGSYLYAQWGVTILDVLDYANTSKYKTGRSIGGTDANGSGYVGFQSGLWRSTAAITQIDIKATGGSFIQYSHFALYGIK